MVLKYLNIYVSLLVFIILAVNCAEPKAHCCRTMHGNDIINIIPTEYFKVFKNIIARKLRCISKPYEIHLVTIKSVLNLQMTYIIIAHIYEQWDR